MVSITDPDENSATPITIDHANSCERMLCA